MLAAVGKRCWALLLPWLLGASACQGAGPADRPVAAQAPVVELAGTAASPEFEPTGMSFIDESHGWVIGEAQCPDGGEPPGAPDPAGDWRRSRCLRIVRTRDGGHSWEATATPATGGRSRSGGSGEYVRGIRFADEENGWAFDRDLWSTHDGGDTWTALRLGSPVMALETTGRHAYAVVASCRLSRSDCHGPVRLYETTVGSDDWRPVFDIAGSPHSAGSLVVSGRSVYLVVHPRPFEDQTKSDEGPSLFALTPAGRWERRALPPSCDWGVPQLAAATPRDLFLSCVTDQGAGGSAPHEFHVSHDGGHRWTRIWKGRSVYFSPIAVTSEGRFLAESTADLRIDRPDGSQEMQNFTASGKYPYGESILAIQFLTASYGIVLTSNEVYVSRDAGRHWDPLSR